MYDAASTPSPALMKRKVDPSLTPGYFDAGDGELIPPLPNNPYPSPPPMPMNGAAPPPPPPPPIPGANAGGGPAQAAPDIRSDIFRDLYRTGKQMGIEPLMDLGAAPTEPPVGGCLGGALPPLPPPTSGQPEGRPPLQSNPVQLPRPQSPQRGMAAPRGRFPRASSLIPRNVGPMARGGY
jgi:hypothetical protein